MENIRAKCSLSLRRVPDAVPARRDTAKVSTRSLLEHLMREGFLCEKILLA
jgi:hypothetical protein